MSESQNVRFSSISEGSAGIAATYSALTSTLSELEGKLQPMVTSWTGQAQSAYVAQKSKWDSAAENMATLLQRIGQEVGRAGENFQSTETGNANLWA